MVLHISDFGLFFRAMNPQLSIWVRLAGAQLLGHLLAGHDCKTVLTGVPASQVFGDNPRLKVSFVSNS